MMNIHDGDRIPITKETGVVEESLSGSSVKYSSLSKWSSNSTEDAPSSSSNGAFDDLSDLISQLPIMHVKKGLSKFYKGKSQSFTSLTNVTCLEDLVKRGSRIKSCRSSQRSNRVYLYSPKNTISMKATRTTSNHSNSR